MLQNIIPLSNLPLAPSSSLSHVSFLQSYWLPFLSPLSLAPFLFASSGQREEVDAAENEQRARQMFSYAD